MLSRAKNGSSVSDFVMDGIEARQFIGGLRLTMFICVYKTTSRIHGAVVARPATIRDQSIATRYVKLLLSRCYCCCCCPGCCCLVTDYIHDNNTKRRTSPTRLMICIQCISRPTSNQRFFTGHKLQTVVSACMFMSV